MTSAASGSMSEVGLNAATEYGLAGFVIVSLFALLVMILKLHRDERREWRNEAAQQARELKDAVDALKDALFRRQG